MNLLCRTVLLRKDAFDEREMDFYEALYTQSQAQFGAYVESGTVLNNYAHIFDLLIRLRQVGVFSDAVFLPLAASNITAQDILQYNAMSKVGHRAQEIRAHL